MKKLIVLCLLIAALPAFAKEAKTAGTKTVYSASQSDEEIDAMGKKDKADAKKEWERHYIEISFGNSLLFFDQAVNNNGVLQKRSLPVTSHLFLFEGRLNEYFEISLAWNLPQETVKKISGNTVTESYVAPSYGGGLVYIPYIFNPVGSIMLEPQIGLLLFRTYDSAAAGGNFFYPLAFFRLHISTGFKTGVYLGVAQAPAKETTAFIFGIGQRF